MVQQVAAALFGWGQALRRDIKITRGSTIGAPLDRYYEF